VDTGVCFSFFFFRPYFLADRTNGRAVLRLSSVVVCDVMYCG